jgi:DNA-binding transcriptional LysR family regulator
MTTPMPKNPPQLKLKLKLNQLEMFIAVADTGSFGAAAVELECTQSRISHAITELERVLSTRLLLRSRVGCVPSDEGHKVLTKAREIIRLSHSLLENTENNSAVFGRVSITCFRSVGTHLLPQALAALALEYPGIRVDIDDSAEEREDVSLAVTEGRADLGIGQLPVAEELAVRPFVADSYVLVVPASLSLQAPVTWAQLKNTPYIQLNCTGALAILEQCRNAGFDAQVSRTLRTDTSIAALVRLGAGFSILPRLAVYPELDGIKVVDLPIPARRQFAILALPKTARTKVVKIVMRFLSNKALIANSEVLRTGLVNW